ncbi:MAG: NAD-dependent protein deacylase, partial [Thermoplasmata archaeon]
MSLDQLKDLIEEAARIISEANILISFTGAGVSAESGIPTFRGSGGLWENYKIEDVATPEGFRKNPELVWRFYLERRKKIKETKPNPAHLALAELESIFRDLSRKFYVITQNIDNLHRLAGNKNVIELHGNIWYTRCSNDYCENSRPFYDDNIDYEEIPPRCDLCGSYLRPHVVWFGEPLPEDALSEAFKLASMADAVIVIGTSGVVFPAAYIPYVVKEHGG